MVQILMIKVPNAQVSDTTGEATRTAAHNKIQILFIEPLHINPTKKTKYTIPKNNAV